VNGPTPAGRRTEIADNLCRVRDRIAAACAGAGRSPDEVTLVAVTKTYPAGDVAHLISLGVLDVGENRDQEAAPKAAEIAAAGLSARWHYIGTLQRNKCRSVATYASVVQSVDRLPLVTALDAACRVRLDLPPMDVLVQVSLDGEPGRGGAAIDDVRAVADAVAGSASLRLAGLMAVAPLDGDPAAAFATLAIVSSDLRAVYPEATIVSAGMSGDLEAAISNGATHVRVGSALLGVRPPLG
jgi:pyridoxal phosphate enzyme (YggS family)